MGEFVGGGYFVRYSFWGRRLLNGLWWLSDFRLKVLAMKGTSL